MKKISIMLWAAFALAACSQDAADTPAVPQPDGEGARLTVRACTGGEDSRVATEDGLTFTLVEGQERIGIYLYEPDVPRVQENILYRASGTDERGWITFSTDQTLLYDLQSSTQVLGYAPYVEPDATGDSSAGASSPALWSGTRAFDLPSVQTQKRGDDATGLADYYAMAAYPASPTAGDDGTYSVDLHFAGIFALVRFNVRNTADDASELTLTELTLSADGSALTGRFLADLTKSPALTDTAYAVDPEEGRTSESVTVRLAEPMVLPADGETAIYAVVRAGEIVNPVIRVRAERNGEELLFTRSIEKTIPLARSTRTQFGMTLENPVADDYAQEVVDAISQGGTVTITRSVELSSKGQIVIPEGSTVSLEIPEGVEVTLDAWQMTNYGDMTLSGDGTIRCPKGIIDNYGKLTVTGGSYVTELNTSGSAFYNEAGAEIVFEDCDIDAAFFAVWNEGIATINGGTFKSTSDNRLGENMWAYCVKSIGANASMTINNATIIGVQGALTATNGATLVVNDGVYSTYYPEDGSFRNYYALYVANKGTATVNGGKFYSQPSSDGTNNRPCVYNGDDDIVGNDYGILYLKGGYYEDQGENKSDKSKVVPAEGYMWEELSEPLVEGLNTYNYRIVPGTPVAENKVTCNGNAYDSIAEAIAANPEVTEFSLGEGTFTLPGADLKGLTFTGQEGTVIDLEDGTNPTRYSDVTFNNVEFKLGNTTYHGFLHAGTVTFNDCTFNGWMNSYGTEIYNNCVFNQTDPEFYCMWVYSGSVEYHGCTFNGCGKLLHVYNEGDVNGTVPLLCENCKFVSSKSNKAAVNVKTLCNSKPLKFDVKIVKCTCEGAFPEVNGGLWQTDSDSSETVTISVNGVQVFPAAE